MIDDEECEKRKTSPIKLSLRLLETDDRIKEENDDARGSLTGARRQSNALGRIIAPEFVGATDEDDELQAGEETKGPRQVRSRVVT